MKKWTKIEDELIISSIPEDGVFTKELALALKRQLPDKTILAIKEHWYRKLREEWRESKKREAEAAATAKSLSFWQKIIKLFKSK